MNIKGVIFDFDGLILDTETPEVFAWEKAFQEYGQIFPFERYMKSIGVASDNLFVHDFLREAGFSESKIHQVVEEHETILSQSGYLDNPRDGIRETIQTAKSMELKLGIASNSYPSWVLGHLSKLSLNHYFDPVYTCENVINPKPDPEIYALVLQTWQLSPSEAIVFEDSPSGIQAAKSAGLFVIAVPNPLTARMDISQADLVYHSFLDFSLLEVFHKLEKR